MQEKIQRKSSRKWLRNIVYAAVAIVLVCAVFLLFRGATQKTHVSLSSPTPVPISFTDSNSANYAISSNMPDVNNNRTLTPIQPLIVSYNW